jgi:hypothetical protein
MDESARIDDANALKNAEFVYGARFGVVELLQNHLTV